MTAPESFDAYLAAGAAFLLSFSPSLGLATAKALSFTNKIDLYGFSSNDVINENYDKIIELFNKGVLIKNLIKPHY